MLRFRRARPLRAAAAGLALLALGACNDTPVFERESATAPTRLAVPASLTPPVDVRGVAGAPAEWKLAERVADALRSRDIPASATTKRSLAFVLQGEMHAARGRADVAWTLYDGTGKKVGEVAQMVPAAAQKSTNETALAAIADTAAERIAPLVPSSALPAAQRTSAARDLVRPANAPSKPLPPPQTATRKGVEAEESLSAGPEPAYDAGRPLAQPSGVEPGQHAEVPAPRTDVGERRAPPTAQYAERAARATYQFWIQVGSHKDEATARAEWQKIQGTVEATAPSSGNRIQRADLGARGIYYRVQVGPFASAGEAGQLCARLKTRAVECFLAPPEPVTASVRPPVEPQPKPIDLEPQPKPVAKPPEPPKPPEPKPAAKPPEAKTVAKPPEPKPAEPKSPAKPTEAKPAPAEKPKDAAAVPKQPATEAPALPDANPPRTPGPKPDAPISTTPGLPGVLD